MAKAICPGCRHPVYLSRYIKEGEFVYCPRCEAELEVISLHPLVVDWADDVYEYFDRASTSRGSSKKPTTYKGKNKKVRVPLSSDSYEFD